MKKQYLWTIPQLWSWEAAPHCMHPHMGHHVVSQRLCKPKSLMFESLLSCKMNSNMLWPFKAQLKWILDSKYLQGGIVKKKTFGQARQHIAQDNDNFFNCCHSARLNLATSSLFWAPVSYLIGVPLQSHHDSDILPRYHDFSSKEWWLMQPHERDMLAPAPEVQTSAEGSTGSSVTTESRSSSRCKERRAHFKYNLKYIYCFICSGFFVIQRC